MKLDKLFNVLVVAGASSTAGLLGCGGDDEGETGADDAGAGVGGAAAGAGGSGTAAGGSGTAAGGSGTAAGGGSGDSCDTKCGPNAANDGWTDCGGCCCWLPAGASSPVGPICGEEPCCDGRGR